MENSIAPPRPAKVLTIGHSHIAALMRGYAAPGYQRPFQCTFLSLRKEEFQPVLRKDQLNARLAEAISAASPDVMALTITGNEHNILGMVNHPQPFDFILPENPTLPLDSSAEILPSGVVIAWFRTRMESLGFPLLRHLKQTVSVPICALEAPPPIASAAHIAQHAEAVFEDLHKRGIAPAAIRYKLWRVQSLLLKELCAELCIVFLPVPAMTQDSEGMLSERYWGADATHANAVFGQIMLGRIAERFAIRSA